MSTTPDLSEFEQLSATKNRKPPCQVGVAADALDEAQQAQLTAALAKTTAEIPTGAIEKWLAKRDLKASCPAITAHRSRKCSCADE